VTGAVVAMDHGLTVAPGPARLAADPTFTRAPDAAPTRASARAAGCATGRATGTTTARGSAFGPPHARSRAGDHMARTPDSMGRPPYGAGNGSSGGTASGGAYATGHRADGGDDERFGPGTDAGDRGRGTARLNAQGADPEKPHGQHGATAHAGPRSTAPTRRRTTT
jgi:hypothetical protein